MDQNEIVPILTRGGWPLAYLAFSKEANRWAHSVGQHYVAKLDCSGASPDAVQDRISSLNNGFVKMHDQGGVVAHEFVSDPLLLARDWDVLAEYHSETMEIAKKFERGLKDLYEEQECGVFDRRTAASLPSDFSNMNGISDVIRLDTKWLVESWPDFESFVEQNGGPISDAVLDEMASPSRQITNRLQPYVPRPDGPSGSQRKLVATLVESPGGTVRLWEGGPRMIATKLDDSDGATA